MWFCGLSGWYSYHSPLAGDVCYLVGGQGRSLEESPSVHQVGDVVGLVDQDGLRELLPMHHGGMVCRPIGSSAKPLQTLLHHHPLWNQEKTSAWGPVPGVRTRRSYNECQFLKEGANIGIDVPLSFPSAGAGIVWAGLSLTGVDSGAAMAGRDAAISLHL